MKAAICEFCDAVVREFEPDGMMYTLEVTPADGYAAESGKEQALLFSADHACMSCTSQIVSALRTLKTQLRRGAPSGPPPPKLQVKKTTRRR